MHLGHPYEKEGPSSLMDLLVDVFRSIDPALKIGWKLFLALNLTAWGVHAIADDTRSSIDECMSNVVKRDPIYE